jgi:hypothetical protein
VKGRKRPLDILFNLDHPDKLEVVTAVDEGTVGVVAEMVEVL